MNHSIVHVMKRSVLSATLLTLMMYFGYPVSAWAQSSVFSSLSEKIQLADRIYLNTFEHQARRSLGASFSYLERQGAGLDGQNRNVLLSYSQRVSPRNTWFGFVSALDTDLDRRTSRSDAKGYSVGAGGAYYKGAGLTLSASVFATRNRTTIQATPVTTVRTRNTGVGASFLASQVVPLGAKLFLQGSIGLSPFYNKADLSGQKDDEEFDLQWTTQVDLHYRLTPKVSVQAGVGFVLSNHDVTVSRENRLFKGTLGVRYRLNQHYTARVRYQREEATRHQGNRVLFGVSRRF